MCPPSSGTRLFSTKKEDPSVKKTVQCVAVQSNFYDVFDAVLVI